MTAPLTAQELVALDRSLVLGTRREAPVVPPRLVRPDDEAPEVTALAFAAHQRRLVHLPPRAAAVAPLVAPADPRTVMPEACRPGLRRLVASARMHRLPGLLRAVAWLLRDRDARLHPYDTDAMDLDELEPCAGPFEAWVAAQRGSHRVAPVLVAADDATWVDLPAPTRVQWLRDRRAAAPEVARGLLEGVWGGEKADLRLQLLEALTVGLGVADLPFLEGLATDRSAKVKALAARLVAGVPGSPQNVARLAAVAAALKIERPWLVGPQTLTVVKGASLDEIAEVLEVTDPLALVAALGVDESVLGRIGDKATELLPALSLGALRFRRFEILDALLAQTLARNATPLSPGWLEALGELAPADRRRALRVAVDSPLPVTLAGSPEVAEAWTRILEGPLPAAGSARMRGTRPYAAILTRLAEADANALRDLAALAVLVPADDAAAAHAQLAAHGALAAPVVQHLWRLLADLDATLPPRKPQ